MTKVKSLAEPSRQFGAHKRLEFLIEPKLPLSQVTGCGLSVSVGTDAYANIQTQLLLQPQDSAAPACTHDTESSLAGK